MTDIVSARSFFNKKVEKYLLDFKFGRYNQDKLCEMLENMGYEREHLDILTINDYWSLPISEMYDLFVDEDDDDLPLAPPRSGNDN